MEEQEQVGVSVLIASSVTFRLLFPLFLLLLPFAPDARNNGSKLEIAITGV